MENHPSSTTANPSIAASRTPHDGAVMVDGPQDKATRHVFHIFAAMIAACFLMVGLSFFSFYTKFFRERQMSVVKEAARVDLAMFAGGEQAFHKAFGYYTSDLSALGLRPKKAIYKIGFLAASPAHPELKGLEPSRMDLDKWKAAVPSLELDYSPLTKLNEIDMSSLRSVCADCVATDQSFKMVAVADIDPAPGFDVWTMDDHGTVVHLRTDGPASDTAAPDVLPPASADHSH